MDPNFNLEEFSFPDKDFGPLMSILNTKPIPLNVNLLPGQEYFVNFVEPARRGIFFIDEVSNEPLLKGAYTGPDGRSRNLRLVMWPSKRIILRESEVPKMTRDLMAESAVWDDRYGWTMTGKEHSEDMDTFVLQKLRNKYQCVPTEKVMSILRNGGYLERPSGVVEPATPRPQQGPRSESEDESDPDYGDSDYESRKKKKRKGRPKGSVNRSQGLKPGNKFKSAEKSYKTQRMSRELASKGGPMTDKIYEYLMAALETGHVKEGMPEEHIKDYERCWVRLNDKNLPYRCFDGIGSGEGWWGIWHRATNRLVIRLSETKSLISTIMVLLKTKSPIKVFEYQRTRYCITRDRIRDFIDDWGVYKSDEGSNSDGAEFVPMPGRPAARFLPTTSQRPHVEVTHDTIDLQHSVMVPYHTCHPDPGE